MSFSQLTEIGANHSDEILPIVIALLLVFAAALALVRRQPAQAPSSNVPSKSTTDSKLHNTVTRTIRISRIPKTITIEALSLWLQDLASSIALENATQLSITPYTAGDSNFNISIASVNSKYSQAIITTSRDALSQIFEAESIKGPEGHELNIDSHFQGMTVLHADDATDEIVAE
jgi:hypothetical protein